MEEEKRLCQRWKQLREPQTDLRAVPALGLVPVTSHKVESVDQCFPTLFLHTNTTHLPTLPNRSHLNQLISSLVETPRPEIWLREGDIQNVHCWCVIFMQMKNILVSLYFDDPFNTFC